MPTLPEQCVNHEINKQQCPCPKTDCERRAICSECIAYHYAAGNKTRCMRGTERPARTRSLPIGRNKNCINRQRNEENCQCGELSCTRHALCCDCVRFHWGHKVWPATACMG